MTGDTSKDAGRLETQQITLVGRRDEQIQLMRALDVSRSGAAQIVVVEGPPGVGKSTLARHMISLFDEQASVLLASGEASEQRMDLGVVEQLYREAVALGVSNDAPFGRDGSRADPTHWMSERDS